MRHLSKLLLTVALASLMLAGLAACDLSSDAQNLPTLKISAQMVKGDEVVVNGDTVIFRRKGIGIPQDLPPIVLEQVSGGLRIEGFYMAPLVDYEPEGVIRRTGGVIEITIVPGELGGGNVSPMVPGGFLYTAHLSGMAAGTYQIRLVHESDQLRDPDGRAVVFDKQVRVK